MNEKFCLSSALKWFNSSTFLHFSYGSGFDCTKDCSQADVLNFVQFIGVNLSCCRPGAGPIFQRWSDCSHVDGFQKLLAHQCVPDNFFRTASFLVPFVSKSSRCGFHERWVSSFTPRKVGVSTWSNVLSPSFVEREKTGLCIHYTDLETPVMCPLLYLVQSFLDSVSRRLGVFRCTPHGEIICM